MGVRPGTRNHNTSKPTPSIKPVPIDIAANREPAASPAKPRPALWNPIYRDPIKPTMSVEQVELNLENRYPELAIDLMDRGNGTVSISRIVVSPDKRDTGIGSQVMRELADYADANGLTVALTPDASFGGSKSRLVDFYKRFDFMANKGRHRDFTTKETMLRPPQSCTTNPVPATAAPTLSVPADVEG